MKKHTRFFAGIFSLALAGVLMAGTFAVPAKAASNELTGLTAMEITHQMGKGWNLGNTFDANSGSSSDPLSQETSWGNPRVTKELIDGVKAAGFTTIRIPVTWYKYVDKNNNYKINDGFMDRINEVVDYAFDNGLFVILNVHHENWVNDKNIDKNYVEIGKELKAVWTQIADRFADYDQHLVFEGMNEPRAQGTNYEWTGTADCYDAVNYLDQVFVETIRNNGKGHNGERALMIPGYAASSSGTVLKSIKIPEINGKQAENIIISVHCYSPYAFCLSDEKTTFSATNPSDTSEISSLMSTLNQLFLKNDIPVVIGECGATNSGDNEEARREWFLYMGQITEQYGVPAVVWDNGAKGKSGGECHNYFTRKTGEMAYPSLITAFIFGDVEAKKPKNMFIDFEPYKDGETTIIAAPGDFGFEPSNMGKATKINHTEGAPVGFSAAVTKSSEDSYATLDLSKYTGLAVKVTFFVSSKSADSVTIGMLESGSKDIITTDIDTEWKYVSFCYKCSDAEEERAVFFKGAGADDFYLDDMTITMIDEKDMTDAFAGGEEDAAVDQPTVDTTDVPTTPAEPEINVEKSSPLKVVLIVLVAIVVISGGALAVLLKKQKK